MNGRPVVLFPAVWDVEFCQKQNPDVTLAEVSAPRPPSSSRVRPAAVLNALGVVKQAIFRAVRKLRREMPDIRSV